MVNGYQFVFADVFGGFDHGARVFIEQLADRGLFARSGGQGTLLAFAASDLHARLATSRADVTYHVQATVFKTIADRCRLIAQPIPFESRCYNTMQFFAWNVRVNLD